MIKVDHQEIPNGDGWLLSLRRTIDPDALAPERNPLLIVPGYGMNSFIFSFHPDGPSMEASLAARGFEVWSVDLRGQGRARRDGGTMRYGLSDLVLKDLFAAVHGVLDKTSSTSEKLDLIGCSLGGTMMIAYVACVEDHKVGRMVNMGGPVKWVKIHPMIEYPFKSPWVVEHLPLRGIRKLARVVMPALKRAPWLLSMYIHPDIVDMSQADKLIQTVENPNRHVNRDIAEWLKNKDLVIGNVNVCDRVRTMRVPLLTVVANADGIVPRESVLWPHLNIAATRRDLLEVGTYSIPMAHADMFVSRHAPDMVFKPLAEWLEAT
jgi:pimeloyl-ACP methyl ester carboxylesterase